MRIVLTFAALIGSLAYAPIAAAAGTCTGVWPSYWQDPAFDKVGMWLGQKVTNSPASQNWNPKNPAYTNPPWQISDAYSAGKPDDPKAQKWRDKKFDAMFKPGISQADKAKLAHDYAWALMHYIQEGHIDSGNVNTDWNHCKNSKRQWFNMPFQTYNVLQGREFIHGLTREAPVSVSVASQPAMLGTTVWAVAFYNGNAAPTLASVWGPNGVATVPTKNLGFPEGTAIGKLLFTTATPTDMPFLTNMPSWTANTSMGKAGTSNPTFCTPPNESMPKQSVDCPRSPSKVTLIQFDVAVRDNRAPTGWVFGTFVADGQQKAAEKNPWNRISLLGLMWGDDTPPAGQLAFSFPPDPKKNGFTQEVIAWDVVGRLNKAGGSVVSAQPGHLGCNSRLNGPADNVNSSCTSCHMTASVPDKNTNVPSLLSQFGPNLTPQCAPPGTDPSKQKNGVTFAQMDGLYFAPTKCATSFISTVNGASIYGPDTPTYPDGGKTWISTDFSLQMSGALVQWMVWQQALADDKADAAKPKAAAEAFKAGKPERVFGAQMPERGEAGK
ncbi:hypothetical protein BWI17_11035 [Betaproteobacteria bacterium GR16-43]|nr:hypothetical protein BWI17_11035 [Betaproteobacteria bacterium GR16-43]